MRKIFTLSWPQILLLLGLAAVTAWVPELSPLRFVLVGSLIAVAVLGVAMKVARSDRGDGEHGDDKDKGVGRWS
jgi:hypothetical protein